jgi:hypothetical protein
MGSLPWTRCLELASGPGLNLENDVVTWFAESGQETILDSATTDDPSRPTRTSDFHQVNNVDVSTTLSFIHYPTALLVALIMQQSCDP